MKSNIEMKMELMERRQAVHANKIQALTLHIESLTGVCKNAHVRVHRYGVKNMFR